MLEIGLFKIIYDSYSEITGRVSFQRFIQIHLFNKS